jgi:hypothetical protein
MHIDKFFDDRYMKAGHLEGQDRTITMASVTREVVGQTEDVRPVISFTETGVKPLVCNRTNAGRIVGLYGADADAWTGRQITVYPSETEYGGKTVECVRVRPHPPQAAPPEPVKADPEKAEK